MASQNLEKQEQASDTITPYDVVWKLQKPIPLSPKNDGQAEKYLIKINKKPIDYTCTKLVAVAPDLCNQCSVCKQKEKTTKFCRLIQKDTVRDIPICTDCINVFIEYNPSSGFDFTQA